MLKTKHMQAHHFTDTNNKRGTGEVRGEGRGQVSGAAGERSQMGGDKHASRRKNRGKNTGEAQKGTKYQNIRHNKTQNHDINTTISLCHMTPERHNLILGTFI